MVVKNYLDSDLEIDEYCDKIEISTDYEDLHGSTSTHYIILNPDEAIDMANSLIELANKIKERNS